MRSIIRVIQFADLINRDDFIDVIIQYADPSRFLIGACVRSKASNVAALLFSVKTPQWTFSGLSRLSLPVAAISLVSLLKQWRPRILHTHHFDQAIVGLLAIRLHPSTKLVIGGHYSDSIYRLTSSLKRKMLLSLESLANRNAQRIIVPSTQIRDILTKRQHIPIDKIDLIPYGFDPGKYARPSAEEIQSIRSVQQLNGCFAIATIARLHEGKGHRFLLKSVGMLKDRLPNLRAVFVGEGPEREAIERQIGEQGLHGMVKLLGHRRDVISLINAADAIVPTNSARSF